MEKSTNAGLIAPLNGLILAGGKSLRMGFDKSLIEYHGKPQRAFLQDLLSKYCHKVYTSCKTTDAVPISCNPLPDAFNVNSPLNGILSAFQFNNTVAWLTVPVDMPMIDENVIQYLIHHRDSAKIATCFFDSDGKNPEPLFTIWEPNAFDQLLSFYRSGKTSPRDFLKQSTVNIIHVPDVRFLININNKEEWEKFRKDWNQFP